jgi:hypothetical protein
VERHVIGSFLYPFREGGRLPRWLIGTCLVALLPVTFPAVFGYAVACIRTAGCDPAAPPPSWRIRPRVLRDGAWAALQAAVVTAPFAFLAWLLFVLVSRTWHPTSDAFLNSALAWIAAVTIAALPWGVLMLVVVPPTLASFAVTGRPAELVRPGLVVACVRERYAEWNLVLVGITTSWALAAVGLALLGVGVVPGAFYAILVSAHACSALAPHRTAG